MDLLTVDVQDVPEQLLERQTQAIVYGEHYNINAVATDAGTIAYEILTRLGSRVLRRIL
jgi:alanine racemase